MNPIGYYPGCSLHGTANEFDRSLRAVAPRLGVELCEVPQWVCCGATSAHAIDREAALCLSADTLAKVRRAGLAQILAPCAMCYQRLASAGHELREHPEAARRVSAALGEAPGLENVAAVSLLQWLAGLPGDAITAALEAPLAGLKVACYYGCLLVRPAKVTGEREVEAPRSMERVIKLLGAEAVRWPMALECCGGSFAIARKGVVLRQCQRIVDAARAAGANVLCLACPMCHANLDMRQREFAPREQRLPVVYLTQLLGLAMGLPRESLGLDSHFVPLDYTVRHTG